MNRMMHTFLLLLVAVLPLQALAAESAFRYEAEAAQLKQCETVSSSKYSGGLAVKLTESSASIRFTVNVEDRGKYKLWVAAEGIGGEKTVNCNVDGSTTSFKCNAYGEVQIGTFFFGGTNVVTITPNWTWFNIDYIRLEPEEASIPFDIAQRPVNPQASLSAQKLYSFLAENFGKRSIAGMMTGNMDHTDGKNIKQHEDIQAVYKASGYYPALVGFDFMNTTGLYTDRRESWVVTYSDKLLPLAKDVWRQGGIPDFSWHWRDPSRATGEFYSNKTTVNITSAMNADGTWNTQSSLYKNFIKDIDCIADCFLELQREGVACIFRPLHEANGGWFWWGRQGVEPYKKLYRLIYDEMVKVKGVNNVIWDWNTDYMAGATWCPGADYYDVVSTDIYNDAHDHSSNYPAFDQLKVATEGKKIIALAENGPIPDIERMADEDALWSWWMPWYQSWDGGYVDKTSAAEWKKCLGDARTITLEKMPGWDRYMAIEAVSSPAETSGVTVNLMGQACPSSASGIIIRQGAKILVK